MVQPFPRRHAILRNSRNHAEPSLHSMLGRNEIVCRYKSFAEADTSRTHTIHFDCLSVRFSVFTRAFCKKITAGLLAAGEQPVALYYETGRH